MDEKNTKYITASTRTTNENKWKRASRALSTFAAKVSNTYSNTYTNTYANVSTSESALNNNTPRMLLFPSYAFKLNDQEWIVKVNGWTFYDAAPNSKRKALLMSIARRFVDKGDAKGDVPASTGDVAKDVPIEGNVESSNDATALAVSPDMKRFEKRAELFFVQSRKEVPVYIRVLGLSSSRSSFPEPTDSSESDQQCSMDSADDDVKAKSQEILDKRFVFITNSSGHFKGEIRVPASVVDYWANAQIYNDSTHHLHNTSIHHLTTLSILVEASHEATSQTVTFSSTMSESTTLSATHDATSQSLSISSSTTSQLTRISIPLIRPTGISLVSDIDDTIKESFITSSTRQMLIQALTKPSKEVDGMSCVYNLLHQRGVHVHYVSASPYALYPTIKEFLSENEFPGGSIQMRVLGDGIWKSSGESKFPVIEEILKDFPGRNFLLVGDSGQQDAQIYSKLYQTYPSQIVKILIRDISRLPGTQRSSMKSSRAKALADALMKGFGRTKDVVGRWWESADEEDEPMSEEGELMPIGVSEEEGEEDVEMVTPEESTSTTVSPFDQTMPQDNMMQNVPPVLLALPPSVWKMFKIAEEILDDEVVKEVVKSRNR